MVVSKIDENINYLETNNLDKNDQGESYAYKATIYSKSVNLFVENLILNILIIILFILTSI